MYAFPFCVCTYSKNLWPELLGVDGGVAAATIERQNPRVNAIIVSERTGGTPSDHRCDRVIVWVNNRGRVTRVPQIR
ncbi:hypothetical protein ACHQM5_014420 [Ranunculus cassubicifolius]